jgi:excisionase family DNA binding protein
MSSPELKADDVNFMTTRAVARQLGLAVRSIQLMVDRGELKAWRTSGGHRRIERESVQLWHARESNGATHAEAGSAILPTDFFTYKNFAPKTDQPRSVLLIEDSIHFQTLVKLLFAQTFPDVKLHVADDGIVGLAMAGQLQPDVLIIDILLPSLNGATLINTLRSHPQFDRSHVLVLTSLEASQLGPYAFALGGVPVVHKPQLVTDLPPLLAGLLKIKLP